MSEGWIIIDDPLWPDPKNPFPEDSYFGRIWRRQENARLWAKVRPWYEELKTRRLGEYRQTFECDPWRRNL